MVGNTVIKILCFFLSMIVFSDCNYTGGGWKVTEVHLLLHFSKYYSCVKWNVKCQLIWQYIFQLLENYTHQHLHYNLLTITLGEFKNLQSLYTSFPQYGIQFTHQQNFNPNTATKSAIRILCQPRFDADIKYLLLRMPFCVLDSRKSMFIDAPSRIHCPKSKCIILVPLK